MEQREPFASMTASVSTGDYEEDCLDVNAIKYLVLKAHTRFLSSLFISVRKGDGDSSRRPCQNTSEKLKV